jgi:hypothetical protein
MTEDKLHYPQAQGPDAYWHLLVEPGDIPTQSSAAGTTLLDTNIVRNIYDFSRTPSKPRQDKNLLQDLHRRKTTLGQINPLWGAAEFAWQRHTNDWNHEKFLMSLRAVDRFFAATDIDAVDLADPAPESGEKLAELLATVKTLFAAAGIDAGDRADFDPKSKEDLIALVLELLFSELIQDEIVPNFSILLKAVDELQTNGTKASSARGYLDWLSHDIDHAPMFETVLGVALLSPSAMLSSHGRHVKRLAQDILKPNKTGPSAARAAWGAAWDMAFLRVRRRMEKASPSQFGTPPQDPAPPFRLFTNEQSLVEAFEHFILAPRMSDIVTLKEDATAKVEAYASAPLFADEAASSLGGRMKNFYIERAQSMIKRESYEGLPQARRKLDAVRATLQHKFGDVLPPINKAKP